MNFSEFFFHIQILKEKIEKKISQKNFEKLGGKNKKNSCLFLVRRINSQFLIISSIIS